MPDEPFLGGEAARCPRCNAGLGDESRGCTSCGYTLEHARVHDPKHFLWLAVLFSAMVPIYLSASNWGAIGDIRRKRLWLWLGFLGFSLVFTILALLPAVASPVGRLVGYALSVPLALLLRDMQRPVHRTALRLGAGPASLFKGTLVGLALVLGTLVLPIGGLMAKYQAEFDHGARLLSDNQPEAAAAVFEKILRQDPEDDDALLALALCNCALERWTEAEHGLERYRSRNKDSAAPYALLSKIRLEQGRLEEADSLAAAARALDPMIFRELLGADGAAD